MRESNTHALNVTQNLLSKEISNNIKCQYMRESNTHAINVIQNLVSRVTSRHIKCLCMRESNKNEINVSSVVLCGLWNQCLCKKLVIKGTSGKIKCYYILLFSKNPLRPSNLQSSKRLEVDVFKEIAVLRHLEWFLKKVKKVDPF